MHYEIFQTVINYGMNNNWQRIMKEAEFKYDIRPYKIESLSPLDIKNLYSNILIKYQKKDFRLSSSYWQENQRRIFIWYIVFYCHLNNKQPNQIVQYSVTQNQSQWESFSSVFFEKNPDFLEFHCKNIVKFKNRPNWSAEEDQLLIETIQNYPIGKWNEVAKEIFFKTNKDIFRTPKQCRQRWFNHLDSSKDRSSWTQMEDNIIVSFVNQNGKKWAQIVKKLANKRTEHMIKNRYNSLLRKYKKYKNQSQKQVFKMMVQTMGLNQEEQMQQNQIQYEQQQLQIAKPYNKGFELYIDKNSSQPKQNSQITKSQQMNYLCLLNLNMQMYQNWVQQMMGMDIKFTNTHEYNFNI